MRYYVVQYAVRSRKSMERDRFQAEAEATRTFNKLPCLGTHPNVIHVPPSLPMHKNTTHTTANQIQTKHVSKARNTTKPSSETANSRYKYQDTKTTVGQCSITSQYK